MSTSSNGQPITRAQAVAIAHDSARSMINKELLTGDLVDALREIASAIREITPALKSIASSGKSTECQTTQPSLQLAPETQHSIEYFVEWAWHHRQYLLSEFAKTGKHCLTMKQWRLIYVKSFPLNAQDKALNSYGRPIWHQTMKNSFYRRNGPFSNTGRDMWRIQ